MNRSKTRSAEICRSPQGDKTNFTQFGLELWTHEGADQKAPFLWIRWILWRIREEGRLPQTNNIKETPPITISVRLTSYVDLVR